MSDLTRNGVFGLPLSDDPADYPPTHDEDPSFYDNEPDYSVTYGDEPKTDPCAACGIRSTEGANGAGERKCVTHLAADEDAGDAVEWDDDAPQSAQLRYRDPERWRALRAQEEADNPLLAAARRRRGD